MRVLSNLHQFRGWGCWRSGLGVGITFLVHGSEQRAMWKIGPDGWASLALEGSSIA
jgi:hypothetical protein